MGDTAADTWPPITSVSCGTAPLYATISILRLSDRLIISSLRWLVVPNPDVAHVYLSRFALTSLANSVRFFAGISLFTATTKGT